MPITVICNQLPIRGYPIGAEALDSALREIAQSDSRQIGIHLLDMWTDMVRYSDVKYNMIWLTMQQLQWCYIYSSFDSPKYPITNYHKGI